MTKAEGDKTRDSEARGGKTKQKKRQSGEGFMVRLAGCGSGIEQFCCLLFRATGHFVHTLLRRHGSLRAHPLLYHLIPILTGTSCACYLLYFLACITLGCGSALCIFLWKARILARSWLSGHGQPCPTRMITVGHRLYVRCLLFRAMGHFMHTLLRSYGSLCAHPAPPPSHPYPDNS